MNMLTTNPGIKGLREISLAKKNKVHFMLNRNWYFQKLLIVLFFITCTFCNAQNTGDYRSVASGAWNNNAIWQIFDGTVWQSSTNFPASGTSAIITVRSGDSVTIPSNFSYEMGNNIQIGGILNVLGKLICSDYIVSGLGKFRLTGTNALLDVGSANGLSKTISTGSIQTSQKSLDKKSTYKFSYHLIQYTGNALPDTIQNLIVNNTETFSATSGLRLTQHVYIRDTLYFENGKIFTDSLNARITMGPLGSASGYGPERFVNGPIRFIWQSNTLTRKFIPVGKDTLYRPIDVSYNHNNSNLNMYQYEFMNKGQGATLHYNCKFCELLLHI